MLALLNLCHHGTAMELAHDLMGPIINPQRMRTIWSVLPQQVKTALQPPILRALRQFSKERDRASRPSIRIALR